MPGADQRAAGVGYLEGAAECLSAGVGVHLEKVGKRAALEYAGQESGDKGVARADGVNDVHCEAGMCRYLLAVVGDCAAVAGGDDGEARIAAEEVSSVVFG